MNYLLFGHTRSYIFGDHLLCEVGFFYFPRMSVLNLVLCNYLGCSLRETFSQDRPDLL